MAESKMFVELEPGDSGYDPGYPYRWETSTGSGNGGEASFPTLAVASTTPDLVTVGEANTTAESWFGEGAWASVLEYTPTEDASGVILPEFGVDFPFEFYIGIDTDPRLDSNADLAVTVAGSSADFAMLAGNSYWLVWVTWDAAAATGVVLDRGPILHRIEASSGDGFVAGDAYLIPRGNAAGDVGWIQLPPSAGYLAWAEGVSTEASGLGSHAEGRATKATENASHAEGDNTLAAAGSSHAEGSRTTATGWAAHSEGSQTVASGTVAHAEGSNTHATGLAAHSEGYNSSATGNYSHVEGEANVASGESSHAEGSNSVASGRCSHAEGSSKATAAYESSTGMSGTETSTIPVSWASNYENPPVAETANRSLSVPVRLAGLNVFRTTVAVGTGAVNGPIAVWDVQCVVSASYTGDAEIIGTFDITPVVTRGTGSAWTCTGSLVASPDAGVTPPQVKLDFNLGGHPVSKTSAVFRRDFSGFTYTA